MTIAPVIKPGTVLVDQQGRATRELLLFLDYLRRIAADLAVLVIEDQIQNGVTNMAPSENAVYDAFATVTDSLAAITDALGSYLTSATAAATYLAISDAAATYLTSALRLTGTATYDPPSLADGAGVTTTVAVTGAVLGDIAVCSFSLDTSGITVTAWVSAADTVSVRFQNESGGTLDIASGTLTAAILR